MGERNIEFAIDTGQRRKLLYGLDSIAMTLKESQRIIDSEQKYYRRQPWLQAEL